MDGLDCLKYEKLISSFLYSPSKGMSRYFEATALLNRIFSLLFEHLGIDGNAELKTDPIEEIKYFIDMNIGENLTVYSVAAHFGYHPNYLIRKFSEVYDTSPKQYILQMKLNMARWLIEHSDDSISLIATSLSFNDAASFSRAFRRAYGCSPSSLLLVENKER